MSREPTKGDEIGTGRNIIEAYADLHPDPADPRNAPIRRALIANAKQEDVERIARYLPSNYKIGLNVIVRGRPGVVIEGHDNAGWTLDEYVLPRLASGLFFGKEIKDEHIWKIVTPAGGPGCYVDGHWGQYAAGRMIEIATDLGFADQVIPVGDLEATIAIADEAEQWLNAHAPEGFSWGWRDGEFFYQPDEWWQDE